MTATAVRPPLHSPRHDHAGERMSQVLDVIEGLLNAAQHPDIAEVYRLEQGGVGVLYQSGAHAFVWPETNRPNITPAELPDDLGDYKPRVRYMLRMLVDLLNIAQPAGWQWRTVAVEGVHLAPCAVEVRAGGRDVVLRVTAGGAPGADSDPTTWADYRLPTQISV